jgi:preprotein translocase subunit SecG
LYFEDKKVLYIPNHRFLDHLKSIKNEKVMGCKNKEGSSFFSKTLKQITNVLFLLFMFSSLFLYFWCLEKICNLSICTSNDIKTVIDLVKK